MVELEEVKDESFLNQAQDEEWDSDDDSDASSTTSSLAHESLADRLAALKDMVPARRRAQLQRSADRAHRVVSTGLSYTGKALWVVCTSALLLGVPFLLAYSDDEALAEQEQQMKMQQTASEFMSAGASSQGEEKAAL